MVAFRSRRIDALLGMRLEDVEHQHLRALVPAQAGEAFDLDFKAESYGHSESDKHKLASDVAALANTAGGVLILGIAEDEHGRAGAAPGVSVSDAERRHIHQVVGSRVVPMPVFDVLPVEDPASPGHGFLVVAVTRGPLAPHAVLVNEGLRYPRRNGTTIRYLSEPEVATAYRERFTAAHQQIDRAQQIEHAIHPHLAASPGHCWVVVSLVPDLPGDLLIDQAALLNIRRELVQTKPMILPTSLCWWRATVGRRRLVLDDARNNDLPANWLAAELYHNGAGTFAVNAHEAVSPPQGGPTTEQQDRWLNDEQLVNGIMSGLSFLASHARDRASAAGNALVRAHIHPLTEGAVRLGSGQRGISPTTSQALKIPLSPPAECVAPLDTLATQGPDLVATTYRLATELFQEFGLPECAQLTREGQLRARYWSHHWAEHMQQWALAAGIAISDGVLAR